MWEERWHPLRQEWVVVAAHRQHRPWRGEVMKGAGAAIPHYVPDCYLCPGNLRVSGKTNEAYTQTFVFDNDHPCVGPLAPTELAPPPGTLYRNRPANGIARVVCYSPRHDLTLTELAPAQIGALLDVWAAQYTELGRRPEVNYVMIFENKGEAVGVSNPHPHNQIYAVNFIYKTIEIELQAAAQHRTHTGRHLFREIIATERQDGRRVLAENDGAIAFIPYFGRWAYELYVAPKETFPSVAHLGPAERQALAAVLSEALIRLDNVWRMPMPYCMVLHQAPTDGARYDDYHFFIQLIPPLRQPTLMKYLAGPELGGGNFLSDTSPEAKAAELQAVPALHYKQWPAGS